MAGRVEWSRLNGDQVEEFVSQLILLANSSVPGNRVRPSRGDRGIDVFLREPKGLAVYQVKKFASSLTASQLRQIQDSFSRFISETASVHQIASWSLAIPLDPTPENLEWFQQLTSGQPFACRWYGLSQLDALAANNETLIAYHFGDSNRVAEMVTLLLGAKQIPGGELGAKDRVDAVMANIATLAASLDSLDPYYRYEIARLPGQNLADVDVNTLWVPQGTVYAQLEQRPDEVTNVIYVIARCEASTEMRPITFTTQLMVQRGSEDEKAVQDFLVYGSPIRDIMGEIEDFDGPSGTAAPLGPGTFSIVPMAEVGDVPPLELRVELPGTSIHRLALRAESVSAGNADDPGQWVRAVDSTGLIRVELRLGGNVHRSYIDFSFGDTTGENPRDVLMLANLLEALRESERVSVGIQGNGPQVTPTWKIDAGPDEAKVQFLKCLCQDLEALQRHTTQNVRFPSNATQSQLTALSDAVRLLNGETISRPWESVRLGATASETIDSPNPEGSFAFYYHRRLSVHLGQETYATNEHYLAWCPEAAMSEGGAGETLVVPVHDSEVTLRLLSAEEVASLSTTEPPSD